MPNQTKPSAYPPPPPQFREDFGPLGLPLNVVGGSDSK